MDMLKFGRVGEVSEVSEVSKMWTASFTPVRAPYLFFPVAVVCVVLQACLVVPQAWHQLSSRLSAKFLALRLVVKSEMADSLSRWVTPRCVCVSSSPSSTTT